MFSPEWTREEYVENSLVTLLAPYLTVEAV